MNLGYSIALWSKDLPHPWSGRWWTNHSTTWKRQKKRKRNKGERKGEWKVSIFDTADRTESTRYVLQESSMTMQRTVQSADWPTPPHTKVVFTICSLGAAARSFSVPIEYVLLGEVHVKFRFHERPFCDLSRIYEIKSADQSFAL